MVEGKRAIRFAGRMAGVGFLAIGFEGSFTGRAKAKCTLRQLAYEILIVCDVLLQITDRAQILAILNLVVIYDMLVLELPVLLLYL